MTFSSSLPFQNPNGRIFYACQAVLVNSQDGYGTDPAFFKRRGRNLEEEVTETKIQESIFLEGVQAVGINGEIPSQSLLDVGRVGRQYHYYGQQNFEITIQRKIDENQEFFYSVNPSDYLEGTAGYESSHILYKDNIGDKGLKDSDDKVLRQFDITILYTPDRMRYMGSYLDDTIMPGDFDSPHSSSNPYRQPPSGVSAEVDEPDADKVISVTYQNCLLSSLEYNIGTDGLTESVTLFTKTVRFNKDLTRLSDYKFSNKEENVVSDGVYFPEHPDTGVPFAREKYTTMPHSGVAVNSANQYEIKTLKRENLDILKQDVDRKSRLPQEVISMFEVGNTDASYRGDDGVMRPLKMLGISSINVNISMDYNQLPDVGFWRGSEPDKEYEQNKYVQVNLPIQVTSSFTGNARRDLQYGEFVFSGSEGSPDVHSSGNVTFLRNVDTNFAGTGVFDSSTGNSAGGGPFRNGIDNINSPPAGINKTVYNKSDRQIRLVFQTIDVPAQTNKYHVIDLGSKNYVTSVSTTGGDAGSNSNVETTISYQNDFSDIVLVKDTNVRNLINTQF